MVNSRLVRSSAAPARCARSAPHGRGRPFSLGYGSSVPSSLTMVAPIASVCSTRPPVSVLVRAPAGLPRGFSRERGLCGFARGFVSRLGRYAGRISLARALRAFTGTSRTPPAYPSPSPHRCLAARGRYGNVRPLCIGYALRPRLSARLTLGGLASPRKP